MSFSRNQDCLRKVFYDVAPAVAYLADTPEVPAASGNAEEPQRRRGTDPDAATEEPLEFNLL